MNKDERNKHVEETFSKLMAIMNSKGIEYSRGELDALSNFKRIAAELEGAPLDAITVAYIYSKKQKDAITNWVRTRKVFSEPIEGRFHDDINYGLIILCLIEEQKQKEYIDEKLKLQEVELLKLEDRNFIASQKCSNCGGLVVWKKGTLGSVQCSNCNEVWEIVPIG
jgi:hypothetical protein